MKNDFLYAYLSYWGYENGRPVMDAFWETVDKLGGESNPYRAGFLQFIGVAENDAEAERLYAGPAEYFYNDASTSRRSITIRRATRASRRSARASPGRWSKPRKICAAPT